MLNSRFTSCEVSPLRGGAISPRPLNGQGFPRKLVEERPRYFDQRGSGYVEAQAVTRHDVVGGRHVGLLEIVDRGAEEQVDDVVLALRRVDDDSRWNDGILGV